jgi:hypothetical protein
MRMICKMIEGMKAELEIKLLDAPELVSLIKAIKIKIDNKNRILRECLREIKDQELIDRIKKELKAE